MKTEGRADSPAGALPMTTYFGSMAKREMSHLGPLSRRKEGRKEGRSLHINSSRPGLIGCTDSIQVIKTVHDKVCNTDNIQLPHELLHGLNASGGTIQSRILVPNGLHSRALKKQMALIPKHVLVTV